MSSEFFSEGFNPRLNNVLYTYTLEIISTKRFSKIKAKIVAIEIYAAYCVKSLLVILTLGFEIT